MTAGDGDAGRDSEGPGRRRGEGASGAVEDDSDSGGGSDVPIRGGITFFPEMYLRKYFLRKCIS